MTLKYFTQKINFPAPWTCEKIDLNNIIIL